MLKEICYCPFYLRSHGVMVRAAAYCASDPSLIPANPKCLFFISPRVLWALREKLDPGMMKWGSSVFKSKKEKNIRLRVNIAQIQWLGETMRGKCALIIIKLEPTKFLILSKFFFTFFIRCEKIFLKPGIFFPAFLYHVKTFLLKTFSLIILDKRFWYIQQMPFAISTAPTPLFRFSPSPLLCQHFVPTFFHNSYFYFYLDSSTFKSFQLQNRFQNHSTRSGGDNSF